MTIPHISPEQAKKLLDAGAVLVDVREPDEHARERIPEAKLIPISRFASEELTLDDATAVIFHCRSGNRTRAHAQTLKSGASCQVYCLDGGLEAWKKAGLPVDLDRRQPLELMRQVQITAGALVVLGTVLGAAVNPWLYALAAGVGAGLMFAGISGSCALARILKAMPWNASLQAPQVEG